MSANMSTHGFYVKFVNLNLLCINILSDSDNLCINGNSYYELELGLGDACQIGIWWCLQWIMVMDDVIIVYEFEAACPLSVVVRQQSCISSAM